ncbi:TetR/AcrR family transcriptional regulator [Streptomyces sp. NPDC006879]|uniref:TetR/AcrR family transcriptional regulator n=1 Tax=Streptomyces sp. NPDC006879 TaxID=3364767 RepID=UPI0036BF6923
MRSANSGNPPADRTGRALVRDEALRLFATAGPDAVSVREIATAAGVSPALVVHHYGSKQGLREAVDQHVLNTFASMLDELTGEGRPYDAAAAGSIAEAMLRHLPADSPLPDYLGRLLLSDSPAGKALFQGLHELSLRTLDNLVEVRLAAPGRDRRVRAALLLVNDLAVLLLRRRLTEVLGVDPLGSAGAERWASEVLAIYGGGLLSEQAAGPQQNGKEA